MDMHPEESLLRTTVRAVNIVVPAAIGNLLEYFPVCIGIALVGHRGGSSLELDALALSRAYFNAAAFAPGFGIITALRTLCPQAVGAGQPKLCALYIQRAFLFLLAGSVVVMPLLFFSSQALRLIGIDPVLADMVQPCVLRMACVYFGCVGMSIVRTAAALTLTSIPLSIHLKLSMR